MSTSDLPPDLPDWIRDRSRRYRETGGADDQRWDSVRRSNRRVVVNERVAR